ncbi:MAG TPA: hypothetical protein VFA94_05575 [Acidimicrobiales bacterium]|nr:hypothetical protein [Acidimicrobiales bacterium]
MLGALAQDAVDPPGIEAERAQPALQVGDVVAPQGGIAAVEQPVAEPVAGLDQRRPRLLPADPVDAQAACGLKGAARLLGAVIEAPAGVACGIEPRRGEAPLEIPDSLALPAAA